MSLSGRLVSEANETSSVAARAAAGEQDRLTVASAPRAFETLVAVVLLASAPGAFETVVAVRASSQTAPRAFEDLSRLKLACLNMGSER